MLNYYLQTKCAILLRRKYTGISSTHAHHDHPPAAHVPVPVPVSLMKTKHFLRAMQAQSLAPAIPHVPSLIMVAVVSTCLSYCKLPVYVIVLRN